jgi:hypothetical protein
MKYLHNPNPRINFKGKVKSPQGQELVKQYIEFKLKDSASVAGTAVSDHHGNFAVFLPPGLEYTLSCPDHFFIQPKAGGKVESNSSLIVDTGHLFELEITVAENNEAKKTDYYSTSPVPSPES